MRVANLNMTDPNQQCPENLNQSYMNLYDCVEGELLTAVIRSHSLLTEFSIDKCVGE